MRVLILALLCLVQFVAAPVRVAHAVAVPTGASKYVAITPFRLADTRDPGAYGFTNVSANTIRISITDRDGVPADATAAVVNITLIKATGGGYLSAYPSGTAPPTTSNVNSDGAGRTIANLAHVKIGANGSIDVFKAVGASIAVDLVGVYVPVTDAVGEGRLVTIAAGAKRVLDTRDRGYPIGAGLVTDVDLTASGIPMNALAAVVNVTAVNAQRGYWTAYTTGSVRPGTSSLNIDTAGQTRPGQAIVPLNGTSRSISVFTQSGGHLLVDVVGWFTGEADTPATAGLFVPSAPLRMLDTRGLRTLAPWSGSTYEFYTGNSAAISISAVVMNITGTSPWANGYVTAFPAGVARPGSSNLNISSWPQTIANHAIVRVSTRGAALYTNGGAHLIADVAGWYLGTPTATTQGVPANPNYQPNKAVAVWAPKIGLYASVSSCCGSLDAIANAGVAATWSDMVNVASPGNVMLFGHRTTHGAIFRYINQLKPGDTYTLIGSDGHYYNYLVMYTGVTAPYFTSINNIAAYMKAPVTSQLVACSKPDGTPTSTSYRITVTARLVSVT
ncbi:MAG: sortase [Ilumatobacteraceae bacterium]